MNPTGFAQSADAMNIPLPGSEDMSSILQPFSPLGGSILGQDVPDNPLAGGPPPTMPDIPPDAGPAIDPRLLANTGDILGAMAPGMPQGGPSPTAGQTPAGALAAATQTTGQNPLGKIVPPKPTEPVFRAGISGAQSAPDPGKNLKPGASPAQALLQAIMGGGGRKQDQLMPALGALINGRG